ncbi:heterokaryon incompatibility protein-domain-containing protein [Chaetomidium leptoderma]|uniref:Heterokaryon incompatibility protein-domain-containing protein n=1 Tax=Chaetomidium leptoderma TaxID=669021 RepID=A0AAN6VQ27_9PEZI|nr:heterokaryon incompatibility protein-domain-containing protein [Chaetomidium leptoderma]
MWGVDDPCHDILVNGTALEIRPNAFSFLETLRNHQRRRIEQGSKGLPRCYPYGSSSPGISPGNGSRPFGGSCVEWIWMDSICINQADPNERNHQVRLMQKIYGLAEHVLFHIGRDTPEAQRCIEGQFLEKNRRTLQQWARRGWPQAIMKAVAGVVNKSQYSRRLWIVQELVLGRQVSLVTANWIVPFPDLADAGALGSIDLARQRWHREGVKGSPLIKLLGLQQTPLQREGRSSLRPARYLLGENPHRL